jgi:anti-anti-sigma regulatory factor
MTITKETFKILDQPKECLRINISDVLDGTTSLDLRKEVEEALKSEFETIYIDAKAVNDADLSGVNEVIHSHYTLEKAGKKLVFVYLKNSIVENWVETSGLDKFVTTAIIIA